MTDNASEPKSFARRDQLLDIQKQMQTEWADLNLHESNANGDDREKFFVTFPYPYMNGKLHIGHAFSLTKAEFAARYHAVRGHHVLFPFAFHCTGMPIQACANKLAREMQTFGTPPVFPVEEEEVVEVAAVAQNVDPTKHKGKKGKASAKAAKAKYQWEILQDMGVPDEEIPKFADPYFWLSYFPPLAMEDLKSFGVHVDWRRSFITTDVNPYYDSFIRWQFNRLRSSDKIKFGNRYAIYSPLDGQACADHDRASGEGVQPEEYNLIKMAVQKPYEGVFASLSEYNVFLVAATLRPETMYGQTNCWVHPDVEYGAYLVDDGTVFVCTERSARNLAFQGLSKEYGKFTCLKTFTGSDLLGVGLNAPLCRYDTIYVLPMLTVSATKGTGVVTSVPSDSPDDYAAWMDIRNKPALREKYGISDEMVLPFELIPIINIPELGDMAAPAICEQLKIKSQNDREKLKTAHDIVYKQGFYSGTMLLGPCQGMKVQEAKTKIRDLLLEDGQLVKYAEPEKMVVSRSGDECVVALTDQWYLAYGEEAWKAEVLKHVQTSFETYNPATMNAFLETLSWLGEWACSRSFGLGTKLPWDPQYVIDSLSDSTIYMAFYTVAHILQKGVLDGSADNGSGFSAESFDDAAWEYVFGASEYPAGCAVPQSVLDTMRKEFRYWYPVDLRVSGKDLIQNHLTMFLYNHAAIFGAEMMPRSVFTNGHAMINNAKMSKSTGNFLTLNDAIVRYSSDAARFALANAGDGLDDANFTDEMANTAILRLTNFLTWIQEQHNTMYTRDKESSYTFHDKVFNAGIDKLVSEATHYYDQMAFREAINTGFFELQQIRDRYRNAVGSDESMHPRLVERFIGTQVVLMSPIAPHFADYVWQHVLKHEHSLFAGNNWPSVESEDPVVLEKANYVEKVISLTRTRVAKEQRVRKGVSVTVTDIAIFVADGYADWQKDTLSILQQCYDPATKDFPKDLAKKLSTNASLKKNMKKVMAFVGGVKQDVSAYGASALSSEFTFNEYDLLTEQLEYIRQQLNHERVYIYRASDDEGAEWDPNGKRSEAVPGTPFYFFKTA